MPKVVVPILLVLCACATPPGDAECRAMLDRYADLTIDQDPELEVSAEPERAGLRAAKLDKAKASPAYERSLRRCPHEVTRGAFECAMKAPNANQWEACLY